MFAPSPHLYGIEGQHCHDYLFAGAFRIHPPVGTRSSFSYIRSFYVPVLTYNKYDLMIYLHVLTGIYRTQVSVIPTVILLWPIGYVQNLGYNKNFYCPSPPF